jgi:hypothetical protein
MAEHFFRTVRGNPPSERKEKEPKKQATAPQVRKFRVARHETDLPTNHGMYPLSTRKSRLRAAPPKIKAHESNKSLYNSISPSSSPAVLPHEGMVDNFDKQDLNALAERLGLTYKEAAARLTAPAHEASARKVSSDPLSRARRIVRDFDYRRAKNPNLLPPREVVEARSFVNRTNYQNRNPKTAKP